jgi:glutaredoxin
MQKVILYTKLNCLPCEEANRMLMEIAFEFPLEVDVIDITHAHNYELRAHYQDRIPVLAKADHAEELAWPFTLEQIVAYINE